MGGEGHVHNLTLGNAKHGSSSTPLGPSKLLKTAATLELPKFKWINWKFITGCDNFGYSREQ